MSALSEVLDSARFISSSSENVHINQMAVEQVATKFLPHLLDSYEQETTPTLEPPGLEANELLEWTFLLDTLNFCFWSDEPTLFTCSYQGVQWTGYRSLVAALVRAAVGGVPVYKPSYYGCITDKEMRHIFRSDTHVELSLISSRRKNLVEAAQVLNKEFNGQVSELINRSEKSAEKLVSLLVKHFPSFRDVGTYKGKKVAFLKRAQIFTADVWRRFGGRGYGEFHDIDALTMFADYRVPQGLLCQQVLHYSDELMQKLLAGDHLEAGGEMEAEIRGCSIWAVELIRREMCNHLKACKDEEVKERSVNAAMIDFFLWDYTKALSPAPSQHLIHRTLTIFY